MAIKRNRYSERTPWNPRLILIRQEVKRFVDKPGYPLLLLNKQLMSSLGISVAAIIKMTEK